MSTANEKLRAWWFHRQGLDGSVQGQPPAAVLEQSGWARSVAGVGPYLTLWSRAGISRVDADRAVAELQIHELPTARGCTYVLPADDFALGLKAGQEFADAPMKVARKLGVTDDEIDRLSVAVAKALTKGPLDPDGIRAATGEASRSLGEEGKKKGVTTTLPLALGRMQALGQIRRVPVNGRLDQQRYQYALWKPNPLASFKLSVEEVRTELARRFFGWAAPATMEDFQTFSGLGVKAAKEAVAPLHLVELEPGDPRLLTAADRADFQRFRVPAKPCYRLVSSLDALFLLQRDLSVVLDATDAKRKLFSDPAMENNNLKNLPSHAIVDRGRLVGLWEYDIDSQSIAWTSFISRDKALTAAVAETETYVREQLGDARSFSLDSPKSRAPRIAILRKI